MSIIRSLCLMLICTTGLIGCRKSLLNERPSSELFVPTTLEDFKMILDNDLVINFAPALGETSADDYYFADTLWTSRRLNNQERNAHVWADDIYDGNGGVRDWNIPYKQVFYANVILESIDGLASNRNDQLEYNRIKGSAYFVRAFAFHNLAQVFCRVYDPAYLDVDSLGLPLREKPDVNIPVKRSSLRKTYDQIILDLVKAAKLLPVSGNEAYPNRAKKPAAYALLSRVYLSMRHYEEAKLYADTCLQLYSTLMDYNDASILTPTSPNYPFSKTNAESMYYSVLDPEADPMTSLIHRDNYVDTNLYRMYAVNDLRRTVYYTSSAKPIAKGTYAGSSFKYGGLATDEVYITRAECHARAGRIGDAVADLNKLLEKRYRTGTFTPYSASLSQADALALILRERRKELPFRGRWTDLRRLNKDGANITIKRILYNTTYTLPPNDLRYVLPIPPDVQSLGGIQGNQRK